MTEVVALSSLRELQCNSWQSIILGFKQNKTMESLESLKNTKGEILDYRLPRFARNDRNIGIVKCELRHYTPRNDTKAILLNLLNHSL